MFEDHLNRRDPIHINCPYCWTEFQNFEQIGGRIRFKNKMYDSYEILPIVKKEPHSFIKYLKKFCGTLFRMRIQCPGCKRFYHLELFPYDRTRNHSHEEYIKFNENDQTIVGDYTLLDKLGLISKKIGIMSVLYDHYRRVFPFFVIPFFVFLLGFWFKNQQLSELFPLYLTIFVFMGILLSLFQWQNKHYTNIKTLENLPFQIHENYKKTYSSSIFQKKIIDRLGVYKRPDLWILLVVELLILTILTLTLKTVLIDLISSDNLLFKMILFLFLVILLTSMYIYYLIFAVVGSSMIDFFSRLMFIFKNIPIRLDPWDKNFGIKQVTYIWLSTLVTYVVISVIFPAILLYKQFSEFFSHLITSSDKLSVIAQLFSNSSFVFMVVGNMFVIGIFLYTIYLLQTNIDERKDELKREIKEKIESIAQQDTVSNQELSKISFLKLEYEQIEKIPSIPMPYGIYLTILYAIINLVIIIHGLLF
jgi:flagellar biogenesis protein FliO